jgi:hypothetical protein
MTLQVIEIATCDDDQVLQLKKEEIKNSQPTKQALLVAL